WASRLPLRPHLVPYTTLFRSSLPRVETVTVRCSAVGDHLNQTDAPPATPACTGSPVSRVAPKFESRSSNALWYSPRSAAFAKLRSEEHTSELQSLRHLVCRLL